MSLGLGHGLQIQIDLAPDTPTTPGHTSGESGQSGSDHEHSPSSTATPSRLRRRSRAVRRSTGITPTEADLDTPDKVELGNMLGVGTGNMLGVGTAKAPCTPDPLLQLQVPTAHDYNRAPAKPKVKPRPRDPSPTRKPDRIARLNKDIENERRKCEETECELFRNLEDLRRKDLNIRALEKTQNRLKTNIQQLQVDVTKLKTIRAENSKMKDENAALIRVIGKLSKKTKSKLPVAVPNRG